MQLKKEIGNAKILIMVRNKSDANGINYYKKAVSVFLLVSLFEVKKNDKSK